MFSYVIYLALVITIARACQYNYHCNDNDPTTDDVCFKPAQFCLNIPKTTNRMIVPTSLSSIIAETNAVPISFSSKIDVIRTARTILKDINPHRFIHINIYKVDPLKALEKFEKDIKKSITNYEFHNRMTAIFQTMNDFHTLYLRPAPLNMTVALLGFDAKEFFEKGSHEPKYVVDDIRTSMLPAGSKIDVGSELLSIDGVEVQKVVRTLGKFYGSNKAAKNDVGVFGLTIRPLFIAPAPSKPSITVEFKTSMGKRFTEEHSWNYLKVLDSGVMRVISSSFLVKNPLVPDNRDSQTERHILRSARLTHTNRNSVHESSAKRITVPVNDKYKEVFSAEIINTSKGRIGKLNILRFYPLEIGAVGEFKRLLRLMPTRGLIVDVRGNPGGYDGVARAFTEALSGKKIPLLTVQSRATDLFLSVLRKVKAEFKPDIQEVAQSLLPAALTANRVKEFFSGPALNRGFQLPSQERAYFGPYITLTNGLTYSAGDAFALYQRDFGTSLVIGTSSNTGAGGAGAVKYSVLLDALPSGFTSLPGGIDFTTAFARFFRMGRRSGQIVEFFGVKPNERYYLSKDDILKEDRDLIEYLAKKLVRM